MSRPKGTESITDGDVLRAIAWLEDRDRLVTREAVATIVGLTPEGLRAYHRRRGRTWVGYLAEICTSSVPLIGSESGFDDGMRSIVVPLDPATAEALTQLALEEERPPRQQALVLLRDGLRRRRVPTRPRPIRAPDAA